MSSKYTRSKVRKSLPEEFAYIIEELLHESTEDHNKQAYFNVIIQTIIKTRRASSSGWPSTACTSWATSTTADRARTLSWIRCAAIITWT